MYCSHFAMFIFAKMLLRRSLCCVLLVVTVKCTMVNSPGLGDSFRQCVITQPNTIGRCMAIGTISRLQMLDTNPEFDLIDGVTLVKDNTQEFREEYNFAETDPSNFRSIVDTFNYVFSRRNTHFSMDFVYPGLGMQLVPSTSPGGVLEFILDPHREAVNAHSLKEAGTGTLLARQFVLPFILGLKFKVATILPILFGILALIAKKALIISKVALIITSALGLGALLFGAGAIKHQQGGYYHDQHTNHGFGGPYNKYHEDEYQNVAYRAALNMNDQLRYVDEAYEREDKTKGRNFAWNEDEKNKKVPIV